MMYRKQGFFKAHFIGGDLLNILNGRIIERVKKDKYLTHLQSLFIKQMQMRFKSKMMR